MSGYVYADTSALAKKFWRESGTETVLRAMGNADAVASVSLGYVELVSATFRASRRGDVSVEDVPRVLAEIKRDWENIVRIPANDDLVREAAELVPKHPIRAYDSMHLAAALRWQSMAGAPVLFLAFDRDLLAAASREGLLTESASCCP